MGLISWIVAQILLGHHGQEATANVRPNVSRDVVNYGSIELKNAARDGDLQGSCKFAATEMFPQKC